MLVEVALDFAGGAVSTEVSGAVASTVNPLVSLAVRRCRSSGSRDAGVAPLAGSLITSTLPSPNGTTDLTLHVCPPSGMSLTDHGEVQSVQAPLSRRHCVEVPGCAVNVTFIERLRVVPFGPVGSRLTRFSIASMKL